MLKAVAMRDALNMEVELGLVPNTQTAASEGRFPNKGAPLYTKYTDVSVLHIDK
jgi:hypothetical protein